MNRVLLIGAGSLLVYAAWRYSQDETSWGAMDAGLDSAVSDAFYAVQDVAESALQVVGLTMWSPDKVPTQYRAAIAQAEASNGIPRDMLARLLWQESRFRDDIISGRKKSPAGAIGIAQFMPATAPQWSVNLYDGSPFDDIAGAGRYLAWLYRQTGTWKEALAAYNWGIGNLKRKGLASAPTETRNYFTQILADLGLSGGTVA